jgi:acyl-CoA synthetase (NDP forming)
MNREIEEVILQDNYIPFMDDPENALSAMPALCLYGEIRRGKVYQERSKR